MFASNFKLIDGLIYQIVGLSHFWLLPGEAATKLKYDGLMTASERAELASVLSQYDQQFNAEKVA